MFLKKAFKLKRTIAFRLTLWYAFIFTLSTFLAFLFFYYLITSFILHRIDDDLVESMNSFYKVLEQKGINGVISEAIRETKGAGENKVFFRNPILETVKPSDRHHEVRVFYAILDANNIMQLGRSMENHNRIIGAFRDFFFLTMSGIFLFAVLAGWFMARRALSGVGKVNQIAKEISEGSLNKRVPLQHTGDNIAHDLKSPITRIRGSAEIALTTGVSENDFNDCKPGGQCN